MKAVLMMKPMRVSKGVDALGLSVSFVVACMADAEGKQRLDGEIEIHRYEHAGGGVVCVAVFENEILAFTTGEAASGAWLKLGRAETMGIADVERLHGYLGGRMESRGVG